MFRMITRVWHYVYLMLRFRFIEAFIRKVIAYKDRFNFGKIRIYTFPLGEYADIFTRMFRMHNTGWVNRVMNELNEHRRTVFVVQDNSVGQIKRTG